jgi:hypothetical protein
MSQEMKHSQIDVGGFVLHAQHACRRRTSMMAQSLFFSHDSQWLSTHCQHNQLLHIGDL